VVDAIIEQIEQTKGGILWWFSLPHSGRHNRTVLRRKLAHIVLQASLPTPLLHAMLLASLSVEGKPDNRGSYLYHWLLHNVYGNNVNLLYQAWFIAKAQDADSKAPKR